MTLVSIGDHIVNLEMVSAAHWERDKLFLHLSGGRWLTFSGDPAQTIWQALEARVANVPGEPIRQ